MELDSIPLLLEPVVGHSLWFPCASWQKLQTQHLQLRQLPWKHRDGKGAAGVSQHGKMSFPSTSPISLAVFGSCSAHTEEVAMPGSCCVSSCVWIPSDFVGSRAIPPRVGHRAPVGLVESPQSCVYPRVCCCQTSFYPPHPPSSFHNPTV